jgi:hypothetical protein
MSADQRNVNEADQGFSPGTARVFEWLDEIYFRIGQQAGGNEEAMTFSIEQARRIAVELSEELDGGDTGWETDLLNRLMGKVWEGLGIEAMGQVRVEHQALLERTGQI